jgi:hypothetical protein
MLTLELTAKEVPILANGSRRHRKTMMRFFVSAKVLPYPRQIRNLV